MPPTTRPTGPPSNKPDPAPNTAPTLSARELVGAKARAIRIGAAASKVLRMVHPHKAKCEVEHKSLRDSTRQTGRRLFSVDCCGIATRCASGNSGRAAEQVEIRMIQTT